MFAESEAGVPQTATTLELHRMISQELDPVLTPASIYTLLVRQALLKISSKPSIYPAMLDRFVVRLKSPSYAETLTQPFDLRSILPTVGSEKSAETLLVLKGQLSLALSLAEPAKFPQVLPVEIRLDAPTETERLSAGLAAWVLLSGPLALYPEPVHGERYGLAAVIARSEAGCRAAVRKDQGEEWTGYVGEESVASIPDWESLMRWMVKDAQIPALAVYMKRDSPSLRLDKIAVQQLCEFVSRHTHTKAEPAPKPDSKVEQRDVANEPPVARPNTTPHPKASEKCEDSKVPANVNVTAKTPTLKPHDGENAAKQKQQQQKPKETAQICKRCFAKNSAVEGRCKVCLYSERYRDFATFCVERRRRR